MTVALTRCRRPVRSNKGLGIRSHMRKARVMSNFPDKPVEVCEVSRVPTPVRRLSRLRDLGTESGNTREQCVYLCRRAHVMRKREATKTGALSRTAGVGSEALTRPKSKPCLSKRKERD